MKSFRRLAFFRIATITVTLSALAAPLAWYVSREAAEQQVVEFAQDQARRILDHSHAIELQVDGASQHAGQAATALVGGLFEIAEIYNASGFKLSEEMTPTGHELEPLLPKHGRPSYKKSLYESLKLGEDRWVMRVMVPLQLKPGGAITGYFEGVRLIPQWQKDHIQVDALAVALMVCLASLMCGAVIYPVVVHLASENERRARQVLESHIAMMDALGRAIAKRDSDTGTHNYRVAWIAATLGEALGLKGADMQSLIAGSFLHDVGKIGIPDAILLKPGRLDADEMAIMRTHVEQGQEIVHGAGWLEGAADVVASHHEKWDGSGYPQQLVAEAIPLSARIFAVADVYDALSSKRPYKAPMPFAQVMSILAEGRGTHFDPAVLDTFESMAPGIRDRIERLDEFGIKRLMADMIERHFDAMTA